MGRIRGQIVFSPILFLVFFFHFTPKDSHHGVRDQKELWKKSIQNASPRLLPPEGERECGEILFWNKPVSFSSFIDFIQSSNFTIPF